MTDVFLRCWPDSALRQALMTAVIERLSTETNLALILPEGLHLVGETYHCHADNFHLASKAMAARVGETEWLIIVDDDQLPLYKDWVGYAVSLTKRFPEYAAIAGWSVTHEVPRPESLIAESDSIGCPMIVRRDALLDATAEPIDNTARADTILTARLQKHGKTGIARNWRYNHLGMGYSQVIPQHWMPECPA